jgi:hypothetical protein
MLLRLHFTSRAHPDPAQPLPAQNESLSLYLTHSHQSMPHQAIRTIGRHGPTDACQFIPDAASHEDACRRGAWWLADALGCFQRYVHRGARRMRQGRGLDGSVIGQRHEDVS